ncbi:MAG: hypothetical protein K9G58_04445 [Bacteroidales bacterium]|nr:hypothetical protein [Bacteroidales bacterium]MCF8397395.1 hypothetical protein [Bacteroidales bacterium]
MKGLIVTMVGISVVKLSATNLVGIDATDHVSEWKEILTGIITLVVIIGLNAWSKGKLKLFCVLLGMLLGYGLLYGIGIMRHIQHNHIVQISSAKRIQHISFIKYQH